MFHHRSTAIPLCGESCLIISVYCVEYLDNGANVLKNITFQERFAKLIL